MFDGQAIGFQFLLASLTTGPHITGLPDAPLVINGSGLVTTGDVNFGDPVDVGANTTIQPGGSATFGGRVSPSAGSGSTLTFVVGPNTNGVNLSAATLPIDFMIQTHADGTTVTVQGGMDENTFDQSVTSIANTVLVAGSSQQREHVQHRSRGQRHDRGRR